MKSFGYTVTTTASVIVSAEPNTRTALIHVLGAGTVYLGGSDVTSSNGLPTEKHATPEAVIIPPNEQLYAIVATSTESVRVLVQGD